MIKAIDVSKHQGTFVPATAKAQGIGTAILRAAYGNFMDVRFQRFAGGCQTVGLRTGAYIFLTHHYQGKNNGDPAQARAIMRSHMATLLEILQGRDITSWVALDQELEGGCQMGLTPADNTAILNEAASMLKASGYTPCVYCSASWAQSRLLVDKLEVPLWLAYYYRDPNDPDFDGCASVEEVNTKWGQYMRSLGDKLCGWQFGRIGYGGKYGVGSANIDRDWIYFQPNEEEDKPMEFEKLEGKVLRCTSAAKPQCETFSAPDVNASLGMLELGESYQITAKGGSITVAGMTGTWYKIMVDGSEVCCLDLPDGRCVVEDKPVEPEQPEDTPIDPLPLKELVARMRCALEALTAGRERSLAITKLDECEMWAARAAQE